jgi:hypothetical protein
MDAYVTLGLIIVVLLLGLIAFVVYKESGWVLVKEEDLKKAQGHGHEHEERWHRERREREERWRREHDRERR